MKKIGYTTGVFDLFHIGHLNILKRARLECDHLIVGVTTDELCESAKNQKPFIPFQERMDLVEAVKYVDEVVPQTSYDKIEAWNSDDLALLPVYEPGLDTVIKKCRGENLFFSSEVEKKISEADIIFISVLFLCVFHKGKHTIMAVTFELGLEQP